MEQITPLFRQGCGTAQQFLAEVAAVWNAQPVEAQIVVAIALFIAAQRHLRRAYAVGPISFGYLLTGAARLGAALLVWNAVWKEGSEGDSCTLLVRVVSSYVLLSQALAGGVVTALAGLAAAYVAPQYVYKLAVGIAVGHVVLSWLSQESVPRVAVDITPVLPSKPTKVDRDFRIDSVPGKVMCVNPCTYDLLGDLPAMDADAVDAAVKAAAAAQKKWVKTSFDERRRVLRAMQRWILDNQDSIIQLSCLDSGKSRVGASVGEVVPTCEKIAWVLRDGEAALRPVARPSGPGIMSVMKCAWVEYVPFGVLGIIAPWNYPFHNFMNHVISGLFSGNAIVCKPSEFTSWSGQFFVRMVKEVLRTCGHSPDLVQVVTGFADTGRALVANKGINKIIFTGSGPVGKHVMRGAAANLTPVVLELGGKDPAIVCEDADLDQVMPLLLRGAFQNAGQNCMGLERIYAHEQVHDEIVRRAKEAILKIHQGDPLCSRGCDVGSMVTPPQLVHVNELVQDAIKNGARALTGGRIAQGLNGYFFEPTLLVDVKNDMRIVQEEVFGPVMAVIKFRTDEEVIAMADGTDYGLAMSVFAKSIKRAEHIGRSVASGVANLNDFGTNYLMQSLPFGGVKGSGFGRFAGKEGLRACCYTKAMTADLIPGMKTVVPPVLHYPVNDVSVRFSNALAAFAYEDTLLGRIKGLFQLLGNLKK